MWRALTSAIITINVPVVFMARYVMVLRGATSLRGALEGVGPEMAQSEEGWGGLLAAVLFEEVFRGWGVVGWQPPPPTIV